MKKWRSSWLAILIAAALTIVPLPINAGYTSAAEDSAATRLVALGLVKGRPDGSLGLTEEITRAELVTVIVRAFGKEQEASLLSGSAAFPDTANHWASGNIAMAVALVQRTGGDAIGLSDGTFNPDGKLTTAQAVVFLINFLGLKADASKTYPASYLDPAVEKGLLTAEERDAVMQAPDEPATRGQILYLFDRFISTYELGDGAFVTKGPPEITLNKVETETTETSVVISGQVTGANQLRVGAQEVALQSDGSFSYRYDLPEAKEYTIVVTALSADGQKTEKSVTVTRVPVTAAGGGGEETAPSAPPDQP